MANAEGRRQVGSAAAVTTAGAAAGVIAGAGMLLFVSIVTAWRGLGALAPVEAFAGLFFGRAATAGGWGTVLLGLLVHGAVSIALGILFTAVALRRLDPLESVGAGVVLATVAWAVLTYGVARVTNPALMDLVRQAPFAWFAAHVVFGIAAASARQLIDVLEPAAPASPARGDGGAKPRASSRPRRLARRLGAIFGMAAAALGLTWVARRVHS
jgi:hypothetical protein